MPAPGSLFTSPTPYRTDEMSITLAPGEGAEIKAQMAAGERLVYSWTATGNGVDVDMHGEAIDKTGGDRSYQTGEFQTSGHGAFEAPMAGNHGWFWQNLNDDPVTVTVKTAGFYSRLFRPVAAGHIACPVPFHPSSVYPLGQADVRTRPGEVGYEPQRGRGRRGVGSLGGRSPGHRASLLRRRVRLRPSRSP